MEKTANQHLKGKRLYNTVVLQKHHEGRSVQDVVIYYVSTFRCVVVTVAIENHYVIDTGKKIPMNKGRCKHRIVFKDYR